MKMVCGNWLWGLGRLFFYWVVFFVFIFCFFVCVFFVCLGGGGVVYGFVPASLFLSVFVLGCVEVISLYMGSCYKYVCPVVKS
ncbi:hypothetical protein MBCUT_15700 [Methanobrevibacter cuticularis]|uniref:Uncharacterized protein n=1 Tax=Methanobrevibacter cuticularis TaxID=47311 RepID=A0A166D8V4_9EURY|nr:hypothetical protein [Methanobrevibacter cuticularis]KZX15329.1 hypothetical protein MBCUT_15700 [Methanobrevibacter cuticularis]